MLTYTLKKQPGLPLYEGLYRCIREDILSGAIQPGEKLPSKRALSEHLKVGKTTVEAAYAQLLAEGYIVSREKVGFFAATVARRSPVSIPEKPDTKPAASPPLLDLTANGTGHFPFSVWIRLQRQVILDYGEKLLLPIPGQGAEALRLAIAEHLAAFRGMQVDPDNILVGAGTDFLYNLLMQLLGRNRIYAVENPGYSKIRQIYAAGGVICRGVPMDSAGVRADALGDADILHISPAHHFPTGIVMPMHRRQELIGWVQGGERYIIEDDYDSEFRSRPLAAMQTLEPERVIYMNTFSKSLAPSIRISYMVLPAGLMAEFQKKLGFYSCTVPSFEQYTLARFIGEGYFEKHINRMRRFYSARRDRVVQLLQKSPYAKRFTILEQEAGLHFLLQLENGLSDIAVAEMLRSKGILVQTLGSFYEGTTTERHCLVINYSGVDEKKLETALETI